MNQRTIGALCAGILVACAAFGADPVVIDYAYVSSYDPVVRGNYCVTSLPTTVGAAVINSSTSAVKQAVAKWALAIDVAAPNGKTTTKRLVSGTAKWKKESPGASLPFEQGITAKLLKKLGNKKILAALAAGEMQGTLTVAYKGKMVDKTKFLVQTQRPVTFNCNWYIVPGVSNVVTPVSPLGGVVTDWYGDVVMVVPSNALREATAFSVVNSIAEGGYPAVTIQSDRDLAGDVEVIVSNLYHTVEKRFATKVEPARLTPLTSHHASWTGCWVHINKGLFGSTTFRYNFDKFVHRETNRLDVTVYLSPASKLYCIHAASLNVAGLTPVVLVHGYTTDRSGIWDGGGGERGIPNGGTWGDLPQLLTNAFHGRIVVYDFRWNTNARFQDVAGDLMRAVNMIAARTGRRVHIVGHSMGGVLARVLLQQMALYKNGVVPAEYAATLANVASLVTVGAPHGGIRDSAGTMHGVDVPKGQDATGIDIFEAARQISVHQLGEHVGFVANNSNLVHVSASPGEITARMSSAPYGAAIPTYVLIGETTDRIPGRNDNIVDTGDGLITFVSQRFVPSLLRQPLCVQANMLGATVTVTERILGSAQGVLVCPGDANPWSGDNACGYKHTSSAEWYAGTTQARNEVDIEAGDHATHATFINLTNWLSLYIGSYAISGQVSGDTQQGVTINLTGVASSSTTTDASGNYSFSGLLNGNYTATPSKSGYWFTPSSHAVAINGANVTGKDFAARSSGSGTGDYCVVDVSGGSTASSYPVTYLTSRPTLDDTYKTTKILLRKIPAGTFTMGSPAGELGRDTDETQHTVTLSQPFYMAVFEITQGQYSNVMGSNPAYFPQGAHGPKRPVEQVSWNTIRGGTWPGLPAGTGAPTNTSFMGILRTKTGLAFDLPTEAQWEYACRAGTTNALNNNTNLISTGQDPNMDILGRYWYNGGYAYSTNPVSGAHTTAGSYIVNNWGLYDMHGNVWEWCLDWYGAYAGNATDPTGAISGSVRVVRGGSWGGSAGDCRSAIRDYSGPGGTYYTFGFRPALPAGQ